MHSQLDLDSLTTVCDSVLPSLPHVAAPDDPAGTGDYYRLGASDRGIVERVAAAVPSLAVRVRTSIDVLLRDVAAAGLARDEPEQRLTALLELSRRSALHRTAYRQLRAMTLALFIGDVPEGGGGNPTWPVVGYPQPPTRRFTPDQAPARIGLYEPPGDEITADVVVIGSGAGGSVIAARAAAAGRSVVVLEAGAHRTEADFDQIDAHASAMFLRNGSMWSDSAQLGGPGRRGTRRRHPDQLNGLSPDTGRHPRTVGRGRVSTAWTGPSSTSTWTRSGTRSTSIRRRPRTTRTREP